MEHVKPERSSWSEKLLQKLRDPEYRSIFVASSVKSILARQIRILREEHGLSQADLAERLGTKQSTISRLENPENSGVTLKTLLKIASIFDVSMRVEFTGHEEFLDRVSHMGRDDLCVLPFDEGRISESATRGRVSYWKATDANNSASTNVSLLNAQGEAGVFVIVPASQTGGRVPSGTADGRRVGFGSAKNSTPWSVVDSSFPGCDQ